MGVQRKATCGQASSAQCPGQTEEALGNSEVCHVPLKANTGLVSVIWRVGMEEAQGAT